MESNSISTRDAMRLLSRICKAISSICGTKIALNRYADGMVNFVTADREIATLAVPNEACSTLYFTDAAKMVVALMATGATLHFSPLGKDAVEIDTSKMFGTSFEEMKIKLDLLKV